jgi:hypothetical protein
MKEPTLFPPISKKAISHRMARSGSPAEASDSRSRWSVIQLP